MVSAEATGRPSRLASSQDDPWLAAEVPAAVDLQPGFTAKWHPPEEVKNRYYKYCTLARKTRWLHGRCVKTFPPPLQIIRAAQHLLGM